MSFRLLPNSPRNFTEFGSFLDGHDMEVFMYLAYLDQANALFLYFVVRIRRRRKKFTFAISSADEFLVSFMSRQTGIHTDTRTDTAKIIDASLARMV